MKKSLYLTALAAVAILSSTSFATLSDPNCGTQTAGGELMRQIVARIDAPTEQDRTDGLIANGRWEIPVSEIPYTLEAFLAAQGYLRPSFTHTTDRQYKWLAELSRGFIDIEYATNLLQKKSKRKTVREALKNHRLRVKVDHRFHEIVDHCAEVPHGAAIWKKEGEEVVFDRLETNDAGKTLYYKSTWMMPEGRALYHQAFEAGHAHSVGVFAVDEQGNETLAAGSFLHEFDGMVMMVAAFTSKTNMVDVSPITAEFPNQKRFTVDTAYPDAGHVEEAATLLYLNALGFPVADSGLLYRNYGMYFYKEIHEGQPFNIPLRTFVQMKAAAKQRGVRFPAAPADGQGRDITALLEQYSAPRVNGVQEGRAPVPKPPAIADTEVDKHLGG